MSTNYTKTEQTVPDITKPQTVQDNTIIQEEQKEKYYNAKDTNAEYINPKNIKNGGKSKKSRKMRKSGKKMRKSGKKMRKSKK